jgi:hypothetical protein
MKNTYKPFEGTNNVSFGDKRYEIRKKLNSNYKEFKRNQFSENTLDYFEELGFFILYSKEDICEAIEFTNNSNLYNNGENLFSLSYSELRNKYDNASSNIEEEDEVGITYHDLGFGANCECSTNKIESIIIFSKDYWNENC